MIQVKDVMKTDLPSIAPDGTLLQAAQRMMASGVEALFVMEGDRLQGMVGLRDLFTAPVPAHYGGGMRARRDADQLVEAWERTPVRYLMNEKLITVNDDAPVLRAAELMVNTGRHPLPVLREGRLVGAVSRADVVRALLATRQEGTP